VTAEGLPLSRVRTSVVNLVNDRLTATIVTALRDDDVRAIVLKGPSIRKWLYTEDEDRLSDDIDLLVPPSARRVVDARLAELGLRYLGPSKVGRGRLHERLWQHPETATIVELHESLSGIGVVAEKAWSVLSARTEEMEVASQPVEVLDVPRRALHVALHASQHGPAFPRPIADLERAVVAVPEQAWREAADLARRLDAVPALAAGLGLAENGSRLASRLGLPPGTWSLDVALRVGGAPPVAEGLAWFLRLRGMRAKLVFLAQALVPPPSLMRAWSPLARKSGGGLVIVYLWRPLWLARHAIPAYVALRRAQRRSDPPASGDDHESP
jgi:Uncharacterised nucleotidyltransferase